jgi:hypothetical protein
MQDCYGESTNRVCCAVSRDRRAMTDGGLFNHGGHGGHGGHGDDLVQRTREAYKAHAPCVLREKNCSQDA